MLRVAAISAIVLLIVFFSPSGLPQQKNGAINILEKTQETYRSLKSIQIEGITVTDLRGTDVQSKIEDHFKAAFVAPAKLRVEHSSPATNVLLVSDGHTAWIYSPLNNTYAKVDIMRFSKSRADTSEQLLNLEALSGAVGTGSDLFQSAIVAGIKDAKILNEQDLEFEGRKVKCWVVRAEYAYPKKGKLQPFTRTYWIDEVRNVVLRQSLETQRESGDGNGITNYLQYTSTVTKLVLNEPISEKQFLFTPPKGATEVEMPLANPPSKRF